MGKMYTHRWFVPPALAGRGTKSADSFMDDDRDVGTDVGIDFGADIG